MNDTLHMDELRQTAKNFTKEEQRVILEEVDEELIIEQIKKELKRLRELEAGVIHLAKSFK